MKEGGGGRDKRFPFLPISSLFIPGLFCALVPTFSTNSRGNACYAGYMAIRFSFFLSLFLSFFLFFYFFFQPIISLQSLKKPVFNGHSWLIADWLLNRSLTIPKVGHWRKHTKKWRWYLRKISITRPIKLKDCFYLFLPQKKRSKQTLIKGMQSIYCSCIH